MHGVAYKGYQGHAGIRPGGHAAVRDSGGMPGSDPEAIELCGAHNIEQLRQEFGII